MGARSFQNGKILKKYYPDAKVYDIKGDTDSLRDVLAQDIIFVAVNFLDNCRTQESRNQLNDYFAAIRPKSIVIIKSTFVPGTLDYFQELHKHLYFIYNCEFLTELSAWDDFTKPTFQILGVPHQSLHLIHDVFVMIPDAPIKKVISPKDDEKLKHALNGYYATKVIYFNQLYDVCKELGADYETIREIMVRDSRIGDSHSIIFHKGYRGFGGKCLPKEVENMRYISHFPLLNTIAEINDNLHRK